jgi:hypothetical protein
MNLSPPELSYEKWQRELFKLKEVLTSKKKIPKGIKLSGGMYNFMML